MDETEQSKQTTPLGNERRDNPGQTNIMMNSDGADLTPAAPQWDENTPLEDIAKQYSDIGGKFNDLVENAADNVGDRQVQLVGNDFGATNPYMFNTYYEPAATSFASKMRVEGTNEALNEGLDRAEKEAQKNLAAAKQRYNNAVAAQKAREAAEQARRNANAYASETDMSKMPQGTNERDLINSLEFQNMSDDDKKKALTDARIHDLQDTLKSAGDNIDWNVKDDRAWATDNTLSEFGKTRDELKAMSKEERDAFWARKDVGNYWTEQYMLRYYEQHYSPERAAAMQDSFNDIRNDINAIVDAINKNKVDELDLGAFETPVPVSLNTYTVDSMRKSIEASDIGDDVKSRMYEILDQYSSERDRAWLEEAVNALAQDKIALNKQEKTVSRLAEDGDWWKRLMSNPVVTSFGVINGAPSGNAKTYEDFAKAKDLLACFEGDRGEAATVNAISDTLGLGTPERTNPDWYGKVEYHPQEYKWYNETPVSISQQEEIKDYVINDTFRSVFGVDWQTLGAMADLKVNSPDDYEYLMNQAAFLMSNNPVEIVEDEDKEYFINGEYKKLSKGDLVFHTIDGTVGKDGKFTDQDLQHYIDLYKRIYNGQEEASEENLNRLQSYYSGYASRLQAAMAATGRYGVQVDEDIYGAILLVMGSDNDNDKLVFNPNDPTGDKISLNEFKTWWNNLKEDEQYNFYTAVADRARSTTGHYYIYDDDLGIVKDVLGGKSNGENIIGKRGKSEGDKNMWAADKVKNFSDEQCLAINMLLDFQMRNGGIESKFFDNEEVSLHTRAVNSFFNAAVGSVQFVGWAGSSVLGRGWEILSGDGNNLFYKFAGDVWDDMTEITPEDNISFLDDKDLVLGNSWTMEVRTQQRANLNHLIDTTFNVDFFDPDNTYDEATGEIKDKDGNVVAYTDNHYFHNDDWKAGLDFTVNLGAGIAEFVVETIATAGVGGLIKKGASKVVTKSPLAQRMVRLLTANCSVTGVRSAWRTNKEMKALAKAQKAAQKAGKKIVAQQSKFGKTVLRVMDQDALAKQAGSFAGAAAGASSVADDAARVAGREVVTHLDDAGRAVNTGSSVVDDAIKGEASLLDDATKGGSSIVDDVTRNNPLGQVSDNVVEGAYEGEMKMSAAGVEWSASGAQEMAARNYALDTLIESADSSTVTAAEKLATFFEKALTKVGKTVNKISPFKGLAQDLHSMLRESSLNMLQRAAMNTRVAEAAGVSVSQISKLSDNAVSVLYNALRISEGKGATNLGAYTNRFLPQAGSSVAKGNIDFAKAVKEAVSQSTALASAGKGLTAEDTIRILARNSLDKNALLSSLKSSKFIKDRVVDWAQDIKMNYYTPYLDNEFNSDYTDVQEYFSDPTQWLSGAVFDLGVSGIRRIGSSTSLALTNQKINKLIGKIDISPGSVVDQAKLNKNLAKLNTARMKADRLTNQILDGNISVNKVSETRERATRVLDEYMNRITDGFDYEKGMQQLASNMETAMAESNAWDKVQDFFTTKNGTALLGRSRTMQAMDLNRYLLKSNDSLNAFYMLAQAEQSSAVINFADAKAHSENLRRVTGEQWAQIVADGFSKSGLKKTSALFDLKGNTINVSDKAQAKAMLAEGQKVLYDAIYDSAKEKLGDKVGVAIDWPAFRSELNWVRDQMVEMGSKQIDLGNSVRWNYFPTQGIMFEMDPETPIALAGFYYGSGLHPDVSNQMANPFDTRDTWDMASISENVQSGVYSYKQPIGMKEQIRNEAHGITATQKEIPYNMDFFNPVYALTAYRNAFNSKQFAAKMFDPMSNGHVVVKSDSALQYATDSTNTRLSSSADVLEAKLKKEYTDAHQPKTYRNTKKLAQDIDALRSKAQTGITDVQKNIRNVSSRDVNAQTRKLNKELAKGEEAVVKSDLFKGYRDYAGLKGKSSKTVAKSMMDNYDQAVADVKAVRKALKAGQEAPEGVSDAYKSSTLYRQNIDALARDKNLTRDVIGNNQSIRIGGENGVDLNANALKTPFYNTIASLEQTKRINKSWNNFMKALSEDNALVTGTKYSLQDFIEIHSLDETDLRKNMSAKIFDIVNDKYGTFNEVTGGKTLNKTFSKTLNQAIYDAIDDVSLRKAAGEGISMVEVIEELNNKFPGMEIAGDEKYWNLLTDLSKYSNGGGDITTLKASISAELQHRANKGELNSKEAQKLIKMLGVIDEASDQSSRLSGLANNSAAIMDIDEALDAGDERMLIDENANPETQAIEREIAAENTPDEKVSDVINKTYDVSALSDKERLKALTEGLEVLRKNASGASDVATRAEFNSNVFKTFRSEVKEPYNNIASEIEKNLKKKGVEINDNIKTILYPPEKGIFEGVSDAQMLRYRRDLERGQDIRVGKTYYKGDGKTVRQGLEIGQDGRGIVNYYKPKALQKLAEKYDIKLTKKNAAALDKLTNGSTEFSLGGKKYAVGYAEFAEAMAGNEYRYTPKDNVVNLRTAIENDISGHKTNATRLLRTSEEGLGTTAPKEGKFWNNGPTIKMLDANDNAISISLITDTGTLGASEAAQQFNKTTSDAVGYHLVVTKEDGSAESFADFEELANSNIFKKSTTSAQELKDAFKEADQTSPVIKTIDANDEEVSIKLITDKNSYRLEATTADGAVESFDSFEKLANSDIFKKKNGEAPYTSASELEDAFRESGYTIPEASYGDAKTNYFGKMDADEIEERKINEYIDRKRSENTARKTTSKGTAVSTGKSDVKKKPSAADIRTQRELNEWNIAQQKRFNEYDNVATERTAPEDFLRTSRVKIISGGQTGVDTIGLEVGKELGLETGGTAAPGFYRELNKDKYTAKDMAAFGLKEIDADTQAKGLEASGQFYNPRTEQNVINSDGTVYFSSNTNSAGYAATKRFADANEKPFILNPTASQLREWMAANNVKTLNVAGSRGSHIDDNFSKRVKGILTTALKDSNNASNQTKVGTFEASSAGHKEFSALNAKFAEGTKIMGIDVSGRTIEDVYQKELKGSGKNQAPATDSILGKATADAEKKAGRALTKAEKESISQRYYDRLWDVWGEQNPELKAQIENLPAGTKITDQFAKTGVSQANSLQRWVKPAQAEASDVRNPKNWSIESIMFTNRKTDAARKAYFDDYNRYQRLKEISKDYTNNSSALDFAEETSSYSMTISEQKLNTFLYGDAQGRTGHFDKVNETNEKIKKLGANTEKLFNEKISDRISALKKLDGTSYNDIVETLEAAKAEAMEAYKENPAVQKVIGKRFDEEIDFMKKKLGKTKRDAQVFADHDSTLKALREAQNGHKNLSAGEGQVIVHNAGGVMIVGNGATLQNRISLKDLREANDVVDVSNEKTLNPIKSISNAKKGKSVLKDMRKSFNDGYEIKGKISSNTARQRDSWIDSIVKEARERTGNPDLDEADIYVDKQMANLGQFYFREGRQGWQEKAYKAMSSISDFNKQIQDFHLAGGVGQFNAFTLRNAITMMWQDPVGGTRALFSNFKNAKDNTSVMRFFLDNHEKLLKYAVDSGDFSIINAFAPIVSMDERLTGGGVINGVLNQIYGAKNTFKDALEREGKRSAVLSVPKGIYEEIFSNPTFARWTVIAKADMQMRNYAKAKKFVDGLAIRYKLSDEDFAKADDGMWGSKDQFIANLARLRTDRYWNPADFAKSGFSTKKYLKRREKGDMKTTAESLKGVPADKSLAECASDFFFAINYKLQMNAHPINGIGSMISSVFTVPRASLMARNGNLAPMAMRFAGRGDRTQAAVMIGIAALAHAWNTHIGAPSAWEELWGDHGNKENGTYGIAQSLLNFQDFGKFWIPNDGKGGFDPNKTATSIDPFFSIFTLQNTGARALNKALYPNQVPINWQRTVSTEPTSIATRIGGVTDELIGANLLSGYKALYEVCMNSTYFGNNIWERKYLPDGTVNKNYNPLRNVIASMAHILNLDAVLEGKSPTENGSNRWVKGLTVESGKGLIIGDPGVRQDKTGTVSGSGIFQHEYASALSAVAKGEYFDGLTEAMELPFKSRNYAARAKTALNQEVMLAMRNELHKYEKAIKDATPEQKDKAYAEFANATVNIMHDWSAKYGDVLGKNDELTSTATKIMVAFLSDEYDDRTAYVQNVYEHLRQELKMADGDQFLYSKDRLEEAIASGMNPEEAAATYNKHLTALKEAQIAEYNARKALLDAGINIDPDKNIFDNNDFLYADFEAEKATVNKKLLTEIRGKLDSKIGEFSNYKEMKAYYESLIDDAATTKQKAKIAKEYNKFVEDIISPYLEEYGENILNSSYWDGDYLSNHLGKYLIIPADTQYRGKTPYSNFLKDEFGVGFRDSKNLPSDDEIKEAIAKANKALAQGRMASTKAIVDNALVQSRRGEVHASKEDYEKLLRLRAMLSSRSN